MDRDGQTFSISMSHWTKNTSRKPSHPHPTWQPLPHDTPVLLSTLTTLCGEVVAVGGRRDFTATGDVYQLHQREWVRIGCMDTARYCPGYSSSPSRRQNGSGGWPPLLLLLPPYCCRISCSLLVIFRIHIAIGYYMLIRELLLFPMLPLEYYICVCYCRVG